MMGNTSAIGGDSVVGAECSIAEKTSVKLAFCSRKEM